MPPLRQCSPGIQTCGKSVGASPSAAFRESSRSVCLQSSLHLWNSLSKSPKRTFTLRFLTCLPLRSQSTSHIIRSQHLHHAHPHDQVQWLGIVPSADQSIEDVAEVNVMGFRPFTGGSSSHPVPATRSEAAERPTYTTVSMLRLATGNPTFGDVSVVFRPTYAQPLALLEPVDTGNWEEVCNRSSPPKPPIGCATFPYAVNCSAWAPRVQGAIYH